MPELKLLGTRVDVDNSCRNLFVTITGLFDVSKKCK